MEIKTDPSRHLLIRKVPRYSDLLSPPRHLGKFFDQTVESGTQDFCFCFVFKIMILEYSHPVLI